MTKTLKKLQLIVYGFSISFVNVLFMVSHYNDVLLICN